VVVGGRGVGGGWSGWQGKGKRQEGGRKRTTKMDGGREGGGEGERREEGRE